MNKLIRYINEQLKAIQNLDSTIQEKEQELRRLKAMRNNWEHNYYKALERFGKKAGI